MKILMRGYSDAFHPLDATRALHDGMIGRNSGNLIFTASAQRNLLTEQASVDVRKLATFVKNPALVSEQYDHLVIPLANALGGEFTEWLDQLTRFINKVTIPVTILGVGAQAALNYDWSSLAPIEKSVKAFVSSVLDRGPSIGVRGQMTADYLNSLGFSEVVVIGCPSMFYNGQKLPIKPGPERFDRSTRIAINLTRRVPMPENWVREHFARHPATHYVAQDSADLAMMLGGRPRTGPDADFPGNLAHPALSQDRTRVYLHGPTWIEAMGEREFSFGSRIHGNVAALLAGVPSHVIAHDSRTRELAEYFQIPFTLSTAITSESTARALYEASNFDGLTSGHAGRFDRFIDYVEMHGLDHVHRYTEGETLFDQSVRNAGVGPESIVTVRSDDPRTLNERAWQSASYSQSTIAELRDTITRLSRDVNALKKQSPNIRPRPISRVRRAAGRMLGR